MAVFPIRQFGDPVLRTRASEVPEVDRAARRLMKSMAQTMEQAPGIGLAATQVGVLKRIIVWEWEEEQGQLANPVILDREGEVEGEEGCLSLPGLLYPVVRSQWVVVEGINAGGERVRLEAEDMRARILQHEIDHLDGVLFIDHLSEDLRREAMSKLRNMEAAEEVPAGF
ncbi:MAG: peptide deformylase [Actinobacteria bacterium]|nr:peptide deformylase [Actinomycetota bacterium]